MYREITIGEINVPILATASTNIYFKQIFGQDPIAIQTNDEMDTAQGLEFAQKLTFVTAMQAKAREAVEKGEAARIRDIMAKIQPDDIIDFLDGLDFGELQKALPMVMEAYAAQKAPSSTAKKEQG